MMPEFSETLFLARQRDNRIGQFDLVALPIGEVAQVEVVGEHVLDRAESGRDANEPLGRARYAQVTMPIFSSEISSPTIRLRYSRSTDTSASLSTNTSAFSARSAILTNFAIL